MTKLNKLVRKRCNVCGHQLRADTKARICLQMERNKHGFKTGYRCPGKLVKVVRKRKGDLPPVPPGLGVGHVLTDEYQQLVKEARGKKWRAVAARDLKRARLLHKKAAAASKRAEARMRKWTAEIRALEKKARMSDDEVEAVRQRAATAAQVSHVKRRLAKSAGVQWTGESDGAK